MANNLTEGIKTVGIGKTTNKSLTTSQIEGIITELKNNPSLHPAAKGAFFGALIIKGLTEEEKTLDRAFPVSGTLENPEKLVQSLDSEANEKIKNLCVRLLKMETLTYDESSDLGDFIFSDQKGDALRGLAASILRVRYETADEYKGLLKAMDKTIIPAFKEDSPYGDPIVQIAEPFDGFKRSNVISPLLAKNLQSLGYRVVSLVGRNSGPKYGVNMLDIAQKLNGRFLKSINELKGPGPRFGWYVNQQDISPGMDKCVEIRRATVKRPFYATLERIINPVKADIFISSAFHKPFGEKILNIAEMAGYPAMICVMNGAEGSIAFSISRLVKILCTVKTKNGTYRRSEFAFDTGLKDNPHLKEEEKLDTVNIDENIALINSFNEKGSTHNKKFDLRVKATSLGIAEVIQKIK